MSTINLLPEDYVKQRSQRRINAVCLSLFAIVVTAVIGAHQVTEQSRAHTLEVRDRVENEFNTAASLIERMHKLEAQKARMIQKAELTAALIERVPRSTLLALITNARPDGAALTEVALESNIVKREIEGKKSADGKSVYSTQSRGKKDAKRYIDELQVEITITGLATTDAEVARLIANLSRCPLIKQVELVFVQEKIHRMSVAREFQVWLLLNGEVDASEVVERLKSEPVTAAESEDDAAQGRQEDRT